MKSMLSSRARSSRARPGLTRASVVAAAAEIADRDGLDALTLASLAARLGVRPPSLFNHVAGMPALKRELRAVALRELADALSAAAIGKSRGAAVSALAAAYRGFVRAHPGTYALTVSAPGNADPASDKLADGIISICASVLGGYQLGKRETIHAIRAMRSLVHGFASLEAAGGFGMPVAIDSSFAWMVDTFVAGLERIAAAQAARA
jgi:AcrR family transcriptional regulator